MLRAGNRWRKGCGRCCDATSWPGGQQTWQLLALAAFGRYQLNVRMELWCGDGLRANSVVKTDRPLYFGCYYYWCVVVQPDGKSVIVTLSLASWGRTTIESASLRVYVGCVRHYSRSYLLS